MSLRKSLPPQFAVRPFLVCHALEAGVSPGQLRSARFEKPFRGIRSHTAAVKPSELARVYAAKMTDQQCFSHSTAAVMWNLPLPARLQNEQLVHVSTTAAHYPRGNLVRGHRVTLLDAVVFRGMRLTSPSRTWSDLASLLTLNDLVAVGDALVAASLCTLMELHSWVAARQGKRGYRLLSRAVELVREGVESPMETLLRLLIIAHGLPEPLVNKTYWAADGSYLGRVDLSYPQWKIAIEYEGDHHRTDVHQFNSDIRRIARFESEDWSVIRVARDGVLRFPEETARTIRRRIEVRSSRM